MPVPIVCQSEAVRQFAAAFVSVFTPAGHVHFVTVLLGLLMAPERRTLSGLRRSVVGTGSLSALSRFLTTAQWSAAALAATWQARFRAQLAPQISAEQARQRAARPRWRGRPRRTQVTAYAIFDDSSIEKHRQGKSSRRMAGIGRHYSTLAKGLVTGHSLFTACWSCSGGAVRCRRGCIVNERWLRPRACPSAAKLIWWSRRWKRSCPSPAPRRMCWWTVGTPVGACGAWPGRAASTSRAG